MMDWKGESRTISRADDINLYRENPKESTQKKT